MKSNVTRQAAFEKAAADNDPYRIYRSSFVAATRSDCIYKKHKDHLGRTEAAGDLAARHMDFADFEACFQVAGAMRIETRPSRTDRESFILVGRGRGGTIVVAVMSPLGSEALDFVSLRRADRKERMLYEAK